VSKWHPLHPSPVDSRHHVLGLGNRVQQHFERLGDQLIRLGYDIKSVIREGTARANETPNVTQGEAGENVPEWARRDSNARPLAPEASALSS
jgi:hypothetical protein